MYGGPENVIKGLEAFEERLTDIISETGLVGKLRGTFSMIEMLGLPDETDKFPEMAAMNIGKRLLDKAELQQALKKRLDDWKKEVACSGCSGLKPGNWKAANIGAIPLELMKLSELLSDEARVYIDRDWDMATGDGKLKIDWS